MYGQTSHERIDVGVDNIVSNMYKVVLNGNEGLGAEGGGEGIIEWWGNCREYTSQQNRKIRAP